MSARDPRVTLTEDERTWIRLEWPHANDGSIACMCLDCQWPLMRAVESIIAARLAPIRALADEWERAARSAGCCSPRARRHQAVAYALRAALDVTGADLSASQDHDGAEGQGEGERAGEGCSCAPDGWHVVNPAYMAKLKRLEAEHD